MVSHNNQKPRADKTQISILKEMKKNPIQKISLAARQKVSNLKANKQIQRLELVVLRRYPRRLVSSSNFTGSIAAACGRDETGIVGIVLWGDQVKQVKTGDIIRIEGGWCRSRNGELVVSSGSSGSLVVLDK
tara:strand:+ start:275 stop:670 length:396 start_codon:yes stop_codon:yes gene_type:complete